jgi:hypothetical protein
MAPSLIRRRLTTANTSPDALPRVLRDISPRSDWSGTTFTSSRRDACTDACRRRMVLSGTFGLVYTGSIYVGEPSQAFLVNIVCRGCARVRWGALVSERAWLRDRSLVIKIYRYRSRAPIPKKLADHLARKVKKAIAGGLKPDRRSSWERVLGDED